MKRIKWIVLVGVIFSMFACVFGGEKKTELYLTVQPYNKNAQWKYEECTYCNGTGYVLVKVYDQKRNRTTVYVKACSWCHGTGKHGMSKK